MRGIAAAPGACRAPLAGKQQRAVTTPRASILRSRPGRPSRSRQPLKPMAIFSRYDPLRVWPPYRTSSSGSGATGGWGGNSSSSSSKMSGEQRLAAATPAQRQAMLSTAISGVSDWQQLWSIVERYGRYLTANNITHALTKLEQVVRGQQYLPVEASQIEDLLEWLLQRGRELNATSQLGPQALGATAGAVSRLQQAQRQQQQQQQAAAAAAAQRQQAVLRQQEAEAAEAAARKLRQQQAAAAERDQLMREVVDAAVSQKHRLSPQALNNLLSALADIEESDMSADQIRQLLNIPTKPKAGTAAAAAAAAASNPLDVVARQQQQQQLGGQQHQQQQPRPASSRPMSPDSLQAAARQLGQLSPELASEWYDRALRQGLQQGYIPRGIDQSYIPGFLAREIDRAAAQAGSSSSGRGGAAGPRGAVLLSKVVSEYGQLMGADHLALALHKLAQLQQQDAAGSAEDVKAAAGSFFQRLQPLVADADDASLSSIVDSCKDLQLYSKPLLQACLARAKPLLEQQLQGFVQPEAGFSGRRLGVLLHGLAVLGLRPSEDWLRLAVTTAGALLPSCSITDLERLASSLLIMRVSPGRTWTAAAEDRLEQLAAALGSSDSRRLRNTAAAAAGVEEASDEDEEGTGFAGRAIVACVKALALLGGQRAKGWYQSILAAEQQQQRDEEENQQQQQQQQRVTDEEEEEEVRQRRLRELAQQQAALAASQQQQQGPAAAATSGSQHVEQQLQKAVQQQQQHKRPKLHLHPHHHLQHRHPPGSKQQQQQPQGPSSQGQQGVAVPLSSFDDYMSQELQQQQQQGPSSSNLPQSHTSLSDQDSSSRSGTSAGSPAPAAAAAGRAGGAAAAGGAGEGDSAGVEAAAPAGWAAEQTSRWAQTKGEAAQPSPAAELQQRLDDSHKLFGSSGAGRRGAGSKQAAAGKQQGPASSTKQQQQQQQQQGAAPAKAASGGSDLRARDIPVQFVDDDDTSSSSSSSSRPPSSKQAATSSKPSSGDSSSSSSAASSSEGKPSREAQRSAAEAADALAALMAEIEGEAVAESEQQEVLQELGLAGGEEGLADSLAGAQAQAADLQEAADLVQQATRQLDDLQQRQAEREAAAAAAAAGADNAKGRQHGRQHKKAHKQQQEQEQQAGSSSSEAAKKGSQRPLGSSGEAAFLAAAKALQGNKKPSRTLLLGCLEAIEQQQQELRTQLAKQQLQSAVAGAAQRERQQAAAAQDPTARKLQQLQADFDRARQRAQQEKDGARAAAAAEVIGKLLPLLDSFDAAEAALDKQQQQLAAAGSEREYQEARRVYDALHAQLLSILKSNGARVVGEDGELLGKPFDPEEMEAVMRQPAPAGYADGDVLSVLRKGYAVGDRLVRPALVVVAYED